MKSEELMIGDWVSYKSKMPCKITAICKDTSVVDNDTEQDWRIDYNKLKPIPLTPEILEKNGFVLKEEEKGAYGVDIAPYYTRDDVPFEVFCDGEPFAIWFKDPVNIGYVHELQHALRLCNIDKNIEL